MLVRSLILLVLNGLCLSAVSQASTAQNSDSLVSWQGTFSQGGLVIGTLVNDRIKEVKALKRTLEITPSGKFAIGLGRDFPETLSVTFVLLDESTVVKTYPIKKRDYNIQKVEGVPKRTVTPDPEHIKRIQKEAALVKKSRSNTTNETHYLNDFSWPAKGLISGVYGSQRFYNGKPGRPHYGLDIAAPEGSPVTAPNGGVVVLAESDLFYSGGTVIVDHGDGVSSSFLHMSKVLVSVGDRVESGTLIGEVGSTGRATGAHLDWRMNWFDQRIDPRLLMKESVPPKK